MCTIDAHVTLPVFPLLLWLTGHRHHNIHVSVAECNDNEEEMAFLDGWDTRLKNFDNTDDYRMELARVRMAQVGSHADVGEDRLCCCRRWCRRQSTVGIMRC